MLLASRNGGRRGASGLTKVAIEIAFRHLAMAAADNADVGFAGTLQILIHGQLVVGRRSDTIVGAGDHQRRN